ncbi:MAG: hypothetical protein AABP62_24360 [Planctomycetota bacterium]
MKRLLSQTTSADQCALRAGSTLSEVLISLLVMSIGVVSLATLFPVSVLRSIQATQLTNAANLRYNVEALTTVRPELLNGGTAWAAGTAYTTNPRSFIVPSELFRQTNPRTMFACTAGGTSGTIEPGLPGSATNWDFRPGNTTTDGGVTWTAFTADAYVVDPLGFHEVDPNNVAGLRDFFGNSDTAGLFGGTSGSGAPYAVTRIRRFTPSWADDTASAAEVAAAADAATLPDSWVDQVESLSLTGLTATSCTLSDVNVDLSVSVPTTLLPLPRAVFFDVTGKTSAIRALTGITTGTAPTISWAASAGALSFTPAKCRVETQERRYTWMLSVRRGASGASFMDVVVYFRRSYDRREEAVYPAVFTEIFDPGFDGQPGFSGVNDDRINGTDDPAEDINDNGVLDSGEDTNSNGQLDGGTELGFPGSDDIPRNWVVVEYKSTGEKPIIKKGGFVCDVQNLRWYRILEFREAPESAPFMSPFASMPTGNDDLWKPTVKVPSTSYTAGGYDRAVWIKVENKIMEDGPVSPTAGGAMFSKSVIDVYPIRTRFPWGH